MTTAALAHESVWFDKYKFADAEQQYYERIEKDNRCCTAGKSALIDEISRARQHIKNSLTSSDVMMAGSGDGVDVLSRLQKLEEENAYMKKLLGEMKSFSSSLSSLTSRLETLEKACKGSCPAFAHSSTTAQVSTAAPVSSKASESAKDDVDLFGSDEEDDPEKERIKAERLKMYEEKKSKKPALVAKSNIILDVKPWDDETDMKAMETKVREVSCDGLIWGASKLVPLAYGIHKLQISCVIEDEKVSVDWLQEQIETNEDLVQSVDVAAFNKV